MTYIEHIKEEISMAKEGHDTSFNQKLYFLGQLSILNKIYSDLENNKIKEVVG